MLRATAEGFDVEPRRPALAVVELAVGTEVDDEPFVDVAEVVRRWDVAVGVGDEVVRKGSFRWDRVSGVLREVVVRHRWRCSIK
jgi:hypothetical protein